MLSTGDVALIFNVHPGTIRRWCRQGKIFAYHIGSRGERRFRSEDIAVAYFYMSIQKQLKFEPARL